jgi:hypothetical protein
MATLLAISNAIRRPDRSVAQSVDDACFNGTVTNRRNEGTPNTMVTMRAHEQHNPEAGLAER